MIRFVPHVAAACVIALAAGSALAQERLIAVPPSPAVTVTGAANTQVQNDRMTAVLRIEAEHANATTAANEVNARMGKALAHAKAVQTVESKSAGYSTWQQWEKGRPSKWKVVQSLSLMSGDFASLASLLTRLQEEDGMLISSIVFTLSPETRRKAEDALMREAVRAWQQRAASASEALGYASWRPGRVTVSTGDAAPPPPRPELAMRMAPTQSASVAVEGGTTELTVTVSGDAMLDKQQAR